MKEFQLPPSNWLGEAALKVLKCRYGGLGKKSKCLFQGKTWARTESLRISGTGSVGCPMPVAHELESSPLARVGIIFSHFSQLSTRYSTKSFEESIIVFLRRFLAGLEARVSGGIRSRDVVLQVFDSFFLLRDNPLHKVTD